MLSKLGLDEELVVFPRPKHLSTLTVCATVHAHGVCHRPSTYSEFCVCRLDPSTQTQM